MTCWAIYRAKDVQLSANEQTNSLISLENKLNNNQKQQGKGVENSIKKLEDDWLEKNAKCLNGGGIIDCYYGFPSWCEPSSWSLARHFFFFFPRSCNCTSLHLHFIFQHHRFSGFSEHYTTALYRWVCLIMSISWCQV